MPSWGKLTVFVRTLKAGNEVVIGDNFVDSDKGTITGTVKDSSGVVLVNVVTKLMDLLEE